MYTYNWKLSFLKEMARRGYARKDIRQIMRDIEPFFGYLDRIHKYGRNDIDAQHIQAYIAHVKKSCNNTSSFDSVLAVNDKICAVKMFCMQMFIAGKIRDDFANAYEFLPLPTAKRSLQEYTR